MSAKFQEQLPKSEEYPEGNPTGESFNNLIALYEAWNKPDEAEKWRAELHQTRAAKE